MVIYKGLCALLVIAGTYILSKQVFDSSFRQEVNFKFRELPWYFQLIIIVFGDKKKYETGQICVEEPFASPTHFPTRKKLQLIAPFAGFILICLGTIGAMFF